jgi:hypothetical protein
MGSVAFSGQIRPQTLDYPTESTESYPEIAMTRRTPLFTSPNGIYPTYLANHDLTTNVASLFSTPSRTHHQPDASQIQSSSIAPDQPEVMDLSTTSSSLPMERFWPQARRFVDDGPSSMYLN